MKKRFKSGFTLIELAGAVIIIGILSGIVYKNINETTIKTADKALRATVVQLAEAADQFKADNDFIPITGNEFGGKTEIVNSGGISDDAADKYFVASNWVCMNSITFKPTAADKVGVVDKKNAIFNWFGKFIVGDTFDADGNIILGSAIKFKDKKVADVKNDNIGICYKGMYSKGTYYYAFIAPQRIPTSKSRKDGGETEGVFEYGTAFETEDSNVKTALSEEKIKAVIKSEDLCKSTNECGLKWSL